MVLEALNEEGARAFPLIRTEMGLSSGPYLDVSGDHLLTPVDALQVISALSNPDSGGEGESVSGASLWWAPGSGEGERAELSAASSSGDLVEVAPTPSQRRDYAWQGGMALAGEGTYAASVDRALEEEDPWYGSPDRSEGDSGDDTTISSGTWEL